MASNCEDVSAQMMELLYGELPADARANVDAHVAGCARCRSELEGFEKTRAVARQGLDEAPPARAHAAIMQAAAAHLAAQAQPAARKPAAPEQVSFWDRVRARWAFPTLATVGAVAVFLIANRVFLNPERTLELHEAAEAPAAAPAPVPAPMPAAGGGGGGPAARRRASSERSPTARAGRGDGVGRGDAAGRGVPAGRRTQARRGMGRPFADGRPAIRSRPPRPARAGAPTTIARSVRTPARWETGAASKMKAKKMEEDVARLRGASAGRETGARGREGSGPREEAVCGAAASPREPGGQAQADGQGSGGAGRRLCAGWSRDQVGSGPAPDGAVGALHRRDRSTVR